MVGTESLDEARRRHEMVERQIRARGVDSPPVLRAMGEVRRQDYVPPGLRECAYDDTPLAIGEEQTISQPYMVAFMLDALSLDGTERVLEIGTGSGYAAAVLSRIVREVYTIERHARLAHSAAKRLAHDGCTNVRVRHGDGTLGWPEHAPFDGIVVAATGPTVPTSLRRQLAVGGRLLMPVGDESGRQQLVRVTRTTENTYREERLAGVRFVPLIGAEGFGDPAKAALDPTRRRPPGR